MSEIQKYTVEIQEIRRNRVCNATYVRSMSASGTPISLSKVRFGIYGSAPFCWWVQKSVWGCQKYRNTLWKYKKYAEIESVMQLMQGVSRLLELRFRFPRWVSESTDRRRCAGEVRNPSYDVRNTEIRCGNTRNTQKLSLQCNFCKVYLGFQNSDSAFQCEFRNLQIDAVLLVMSVISPETSEVQK